MEDIYLKIASLLKKYRRDRELSLEEVANHINKHRETIRRYEKNAKSISVDTLFELLDLYDVKPIIFFEKVYGKMP